MFHTQYMLALSHYEQASNELDEAMAMMERSDYSSAYLHFNASAAQGLRTISIIELQKMTVNETNTGMNKSQKKLLIFRLVSQL